MNSSLAQVALFDWPFLALAGGLAGLGVLLVGPRPKVAPARWRDPAWLVCLTLPVYMLHQFEEHGVNVLGQRYHFIYDLCAALGYQALAPCPVSPAFILAVNVGVWIPGTLAVLYRHRNLMVGACAMGVPLVNGLVHLGGAIAQGRYNSGLLTAGVLFLPVCAWTLRQLWLVGTLDGSRFLAVVVSGLGVHAVLIASLLAHGSGLLPEVPLLLINFFNGFLPVGIAALAGSSNGRWRGLPGHP